MPASAAILIYVAGIAALFWFDPDRTARISRASWLPTIWLMVAGSRPLSAWLSMGIIKAPGSPDQYLEGSPIDRNFLAVMIVAGACVLATRGNSVLALLRKQAPVVVFVLFCAVSISWSDYPIVAFKRWIKFLGDFTMILILLTDESPTDAIKRVLSRVSFVLFPMSIMAIKYFPDIGRGYDQWEGTARYTGIAADKNMLGMICLVFGIAYWWRLNTELFGPRRRRHLIVHGIMLAMILWLFWMANSMTSVSCFVLAGGVITVTTFPRLVRKRWFVHLLVLTVLLISFSVLFLDLAGYLLTMLGRDPTLTGRTDLWDQLLDMKVSAIIGAGFESFWLGKRLDVLWAMYWWHPNESHNGYLEMFLNTGWVGVTLLAVVLVSGYRHITALLRTSPDLGRLGLAYFIIGIAYNFTEAAFKATDPVWFVFLLMAMAYPRVVLPRPSITKSLNQDSSNAKHQRWAAGMAAQLRALC